MPETAEMLDSANDEKYLIFSIFNRQYAFPAEIIGEVANCDPVYPLPLVPSYVLGVINRYSIPYALFDIGFLLHKAPGPRKEALVIKGDIDRVAFSIDNVSGIANIAQGKLLNIETESGPPGLTSAVCASFKWNGGDVYVLDVRRILARVSDQEVE
ncbi:MAG: chemotaxis protein CheW [Treponema sp.]|jgi:purine-binding chemotaxis protein CheW|nr:chemotaxis protein CheW [Treponema sp.]